MSAVILALLPERRRTPCADDDASLSPLELAEYQYDELTAEERAYDESFGISRTDWIHERAREIECERQQERDRMRGEWEAANDWSDR